MSLSWSDEQLEALIISVSLAFVSIVAYFVFLRPARNNRAVVVEQQQRPQQRPQHGIINGQRYPTATAAMAARDVQQITEGTATARVAASNNADSASTTNQANNIMNDDSVHSLIAAHTRRPPHCSSSTSAAILQHHEGVIPFRYTLASTHESRKAKEQQQQQTNNNTESSSSSSLTQQMINRKDRARMFTKLFASGNTAGIATPPSRGSNVVVSIPEIDVGCAKLKRVLFLLGSYYNLFILIDTAAAVSADKLSSKYSTNSVENYKQEKQRCKELILLLRRGNGFGNVDDEANVLSEEILPSHRILITASVSSRVAFVRQLPKTEIVIDCEQECYTQLTRFGFKVILYKLSNYNDDDGNKLSSIGKELLG
mmetsp:Transcript_3712/g.4380  ORF Transcript_3712/g.4380 Transcript_3712/m.4380 type:complete len:371 (+) Transcript_3712:61-1173(+)